VNKFNPDRFVLVRGRTITTTAVHSAKCLGLVGLLPDGQFTGEVANPGVKPCYLMDCMATGGSFNVAYDGEGWLWTNNFCPPPSALSIDDKALFDAAVNTYRAENP